MKRYLTGPLYLALAAIVLMSLAADPVRPQTLPVINGSPGIPDDWLIGLPRAFHHRTGTAKPPTELGSRPPRGNEQTVVAEAQRLLNSTSMKAIALIDGNEVVLLEYKAPASASSRFLSMSVGKTVTGMATGAALCEGRLALQTQVRDLVAELSDTFLGRSTVQDLLRMSSGAREANPDSTIETPEQTRSIIEGRMSYLDLLRTERVSSQHRNLLTGRQPGETFAYGSTDPLTLALLINRATGTTYARYVEQKVLVPAGIARPGFIGQDHFGHGQGAGNVRLHLEDWIRFAVWVKASSMKDDCFGDFVRQASRTQIRNTSPWGTAFGGYGFLIWTDNRYSTADSFWASGYGGQRIAWNRSNSRMLVTFSNEQSHIREVYRLYAAWASVP